MRKSRSAQTAIRHIQRTTRNWASGRPTHAYQCQAHGDNAAQLEGMYQESVAARICHTFTPYTTASNRASGSQCSRSLSAACRILAKASRCREGTSSEVMNCWATSPRARLMTGSAKMAMGPATKRRRWIDVSCRKLCATTSRFSATNKKMGAQVSHAKANALEVADHSGRIRRMRRCNWTVGPPLGQGGS